MQVEQVKHALKENEALLIEVLTAFSFYHLTYNAKQHEVRGAYHEDGSPHTIRVCVETLQACHFKDNITGDLYTLLMHHTSRSFYDIHQALVSFLKGKGIGASPIKPLFGNFFHQTYQGESPLTYYDETILNHYEATPNLRFYRDGISLAVQREFKIGYDTENHRITVPWFDENGLLGVTGRDNAETPDKQTPKWLALHPFQKSRALYGLAQNYRSIVETGVVYVGESEKFVLQCATFKVRNAVAVGSHHLSEAQLSLLRSIAQTVILCFDEDVEEALLIETAQQVKASIFKTNALKVGYLYDKDHLYLVKGSKASPSDQGEAVFHALLKNIIYI